MSQSKPEIYGKDLYELCEKILSKNISYKKAKIELFSNYTPTYFRIRNTKCFYTVRGIENMFSSIRRGLTYEQHLERTKERSENLPSYRDKDVDHQIVKNKKSGLETRSENVVINWTNKTIVTDLGEFGNIDNKLIKDYGYTMAQIRRLDRVAAFGYINEN